MTFWLPLILLESLTENIRTRKYIRKVEKNERKKIDLKLINYFYILYQIYFIYLTFLYKD